MHDRIDPARVDDEISKLMRLTETVDMHASTFFRVSVTVDSITPSRITNHNTSDLMFLGLDGWSKTTCM
jgi:hypothetical protein